jgi:tetratricopeptide (TPR) repeat protein
VVRRIAPGWPNAYALSVFLEVARVGIRGLGSVMLAAWLVAAPAVQAEMAIGTYLAARSASLSGDLPAAAEWLDRAIADDPGNGYLIENGMLAQVALGEMARARELAAMARDLGLDLQVINMVEAAEAARTDNWAGLLEDMDAGRGVGPLVDALTRGWALLGTGEMTEALAAFDALVERPGLQAFGLYHKGLALAAVGDFEGADAIFSMPPEEGFQRTRRSVLAHVAVLSQLGRNPDAVALLDAVFGGEPESAIVALRARLAAGEPIPYDFVNTPQEGLAEVYLSVAASLLGEIQDNVVLTHAQIALDIDPALTDARLVVAEALDRLGQYEIAAATYAEVPADDPSFISAELGRADSLRRSGRIDAAIEVLMQLGRTHDGVAVVHARLGDMLRRSGDMPAANAAYGRALDLYAPDDPALWLLHYTRGITSHQMDDWPAAEADFRRALELRPGHPQVLNYLGYSLVERGEKLDEALTMIEEAVAGEPENGAIVDSLGWVYYKLGRMDEAVVQLERAAALEPVDPVVNDHLGDAYWAVGRTREAEFQWMRALSFEPEEAEAERIRRKLEIGLDGVLTEEGAPPPGLADGG